MTLRAPPETRYSNYHLCEPLRPAPINNRKSVLILWTKKDIGGSPDPFQTGSLIISDPAVSATEDYRVWFTQVYETKVETKSDTEW